MKKPVALIILDGWGLRNTKSNNAIVGANTPNYDTLIKNYPSTEIAASGMDVGLPEGQMGNSEVGHLNIGAGRVVYQELTRITKSIKDGDFFENEELLEAVNNAKSNDSALHLLGLLSDGGVHSHINHVKGILELAKKNNLEKVYVHCFLDGRDTPPRSALTYIKELEDAFDQIGVGEIATVSGRYYAMDRDKRWERIELAYNALVKGEGKTAESATEVVNNSYENGLDDEFVEPAVVLKDGVPTAKISEKDSIIFFNFRPDRARQMTRALVDREFDGFERDVFETTYVCMTQYDATIKNVKVAFKPQKIENTLGKYLSGLGKKQLRIAETEKYAHVTFFFNGGVEEPEVGEDRELIPSPKVATYDLKPEMSAYEVTDRLVSKLDEEDYDLVVLNYANPDMVGHTGVYEAAVKAVETVDTCLAKVIDKIIAKGGAAIITADHGNAEQMVDEETGKPMTAHTTNHVPVLLVGMDGADLRDGGRLSDLAPTLLEMMDVPMPNEMEGISLIK